MEEISPLQRALDLSTNRIVSACAGAGKTYALSKRYCAIIDEFTKHNLNKPKKEWLGFKNILVITFTNKAASEMSKRIYQDLHVLLQGNEIKELTEQGIFLGEHIRSAPEEYKNWLRSTFSQNYIMTIDSFCGTILRENAFLLGIDPQFKTSDELLANKMYQETLSEFLNNKSRSFDKVLANILNYTDKKGILQFFDYFEKNKVFLEDWIHYIQSHTESDIYHTWLEKYLHEFDVDVILNELNKVTSLSQNVKQNEENTFLILRDLISKIPDDSIQEKRRYIITEILPLFMTSKRESYYSDRAYHYIQKKGTFIHDAAYKSFKQTLSEVISLLEQEIPAEKVLLAPTRDDIKSIGVFKEFVKLYSEFEEKLWNTQLQKNYLTFNEVIIKTRKLLNTHEDVRQRIAKQFGHILVDEFQDTNNLRWDIIRHIARDDKDSIREKGLFIVGDKKQSIYRFQQADVEVMNRAQDQLIKISVDALIEFNDNYRASQEYIQHVVNPFFSKIFTTPEYPFEASFEDTHYPQHNSSDKAIAKRTDIVCDIHATSYEPAESEYVPAIHAAYMAKKYLHWSEDAGIKEDVAIGILLRSFTHINEYLKIFQKCNLPFQIIGERDLFSQQEVYDLFHFISVMINPHDDVALIGLMRSPFFCMEDPMIYNLKNRTKKTSIYDFIENDEAYAFFHKSISKWRYSARSVPVDILLQTILAQAHRELGYVSEIGGPQRLANIDKTIHLLHSLQMEGNSLQEIHDYISYQLDHKSDVAQGELPASAKIQIMTIHKAKGLEFPAVIIPELDAISAKKDPSIVYHSRLLPGEQIEVGITIKEGVESKKTNLLENIKKQDKLEQKAEDKRLFYVAVTRAKYRVALLAEFKGNPGKNSWWSQYVAKTFELPSTSIQEEWDSVVAPEKIEVEFADFKEMHGALNIDQNEHNNKLVWKEPPEQKKLQKMWTVTPHTIMDSVFPEITFEDDPEKKSSGKIQRAFGSIFHAVIANHWWDLSTSKKEILLYIENTFPEIRFDEIESQLQKHISHFLSSTLYQDINSLSSQDLFHELPITGRLDNGELYLEVNGILDLLYRAGDKWYIVDFKTDKTRRAHHIYKVQLQTYQWMVKQLYNIEAQTFIYYSAINEFREVKWDEEYFLKIFPNEQHPFTLSKFETIPISNNILDKIRSHEEILIINPTGYQSKRMTQALAQRKLLTPNIRIATLNSLLRFQPTMGKVITLEIGILLVKKAAGDMTLNEGTIELLADAFRKSALWNQKFIGTEGFEKIHIDYDKIRQEKHYYYDQEILGQCIQYYLEGKTVLLNGFYKESRLEYEIMSQLSKRAEKFYFINNFKDFTTQSSFELTPQIWQTVLQKENKPKSGYTQYYSIETEIDAIAREIYTLRKCAQELSTIKVAVSSMDAYLPVIKKIFHSYGIPYRSIPGNKLVAEPLTQFIISLLTIMLSSERLTWDTVSSMMLHPLFDTSRNIFALDAFIRRNGIHYFSDITEIDKIKEHSEAVHTITELLGTIKGIAMDIPHTSLPDGIAAFINNAGIISKIEQHEDMQEVYFYIQKCLQNTLDAYHEIGLEFKPDNLLKDIKKALKNLEIPSRRGHKGVEIIGFMDTLELNEVKLFIAGLSQNYFPVPQKNNPFASSIPAFNWEKSVMLLNRWQELDSKVYYSCAERDLDGNVLNPSTLLETFDIQKIAEQERATLTSRQHYLTYYDHEIENPILPVLKRHNEYQDDSMGFYKGLVKTDGKSTLRFSARDMNTLIQCPMHYLFEELLDLKPLTFDEDANQRLQLGNVIHKAMEYFGMNQGFQLVKVNFSQALELLAGSLSYALNKFHVDPERDLFIKRVYAPYTDGLVSGEENNVLVQLLAFDRNFLKDYSPVSFEQVFGLVDKQDIDTWSVYSLKSDRVTLHFRGKIDGIFKASNSPEVLCVDYKTGFSPSPSEIESFWDIQSFLYLMVLKSHFPESKITFLYESLKDIAQTTNKQIEICEENNMFIITQKDNKRSQYIETVKDLFLHYGVKAAQGEFHIRERVYGKKPCSYCDFSRICRKNCYPSTLKQIEEIITTTYKEQT
jgi:ATP-dependent exoDNAse (exonuclease V) beta subunit